MATHSSLLAWGISWTEGPGGLQSVGSEKCQTHLSMPAYAYFHLVHIQYSFSNFLALVAPNKKDYIHLYPQISKTTSRYCWCGGVCVGGGGMGECDNPSYIDSTSVSEYLLNARRCVKCSRCEEKKKIPALMELYSSREAPWGQK